MGSPLPWQTFASEMVGTALLLLIGLSVVIVMFGAGSPILGIVPDEGPRRLITGFLFGTTGSRCPLLERKAERTSTRSSAHRRRSS